MDNKLSMENINLDINSTINEIISNEQNNEAIIKEKHEVEDRMLVLNKSIKEMIAKTERGTQETIELATKSDQLRADLEIQKIQLQALKSQVEHAKELNKNIKQNIEYGIGDVWKLRSMLTNTTQKISEQCDVWSLMTRHVHQTSPPPLELKSETTEPILVNNDEKLKTAMERKQRALAERNWLRTEPEVSDDFVRNCLLVTKPYRHYCSKVKEHEPIKFSTSMAARPGVASVVRSPEVTTPWYQPYVVCGSVAVFLIYFCILREENDIDSEFDKTLYERLSGLEKTQLIQSYKFNKEHGKDTTDIERRLKEIEIEEAKEARAV